jgi:hypothetical protein
VKKQNHSRDAFRARVLPTTTTTKIRPGSNEGAERRKAHHPMPRATPTSVATCRRFARWRAIADK